MTKQQKPAREWSDKIEVPAGTTECPAWLKGADAVRVWTTADELRDVAAVREADEWSWNSPVCRITHASRLLDDGWHPASTMPKEGTQHIQRMWSNGAIGPVAACAVSLDGYFVVAWRPAESTQPAAPEVDGDGWIELDGRGRPSEFPREGTVETMRRDGTIHALDACSICWGLSIWNWLGTPEHALDRIAYRIIRPHAEEKAPEAKPSEPPIVKRVVRKVAIDPNTLMLDADREGAAAMQARRDAEADRKSYAFFAQAGAERCNLLTIAPIPRNGFGLWGAEVGDD